MIPELGPRTRVTGNNLTARDRGLTFSNMTRTLFVTFSPTSVDRLVLEGRLRSVGAKRVHAWLWCVQEPLWTARHLRWFLIDGLRAGHNVSVLDATDWAVGPGGDNDPNPFAAEC